MTFSSAIFAAAALTALAGVIIWANPNRLVNKTVFTCSLHGALWLVLLHVAVRVEDGLLWLRWTVAVGAFFPLHLWVVKEAIATGVPIRFGSDWRRLSFWVVVPVSLAFIAFTDFFIPSHSTHNERSYGMGYYVHIVGLLGMYGVLGLQMFRQLRLLRGLRRMEMQIWLGGGIGACASVVVLMAVKALTEHQALMVLRPIVVICFFAATTLAITTSRVFDAKHLLFIASKKLILILAAAGLAYGFFRVIDGPLPTVIAFLAATGITLHVANWVDALWDRFFKQYPRAAEARSKILTTATREMHPGRLHAQFEMILAGWAQSERAHLLTPVDQHFKSRELSISSESSIVQTLKDLRWVTPERLGRERETRLRRELAEYLAAHNLGAVVVSEGAGFAVISAVGMRATRRPFTYPEVQQLSELSSILQTALARSYLWHKAQRAEQLATVGLLGASVAHEIRNPLVTIKSFVHLLPQHYGDPLFRERFFRLIGEEVGRIDRLVEQLLDLASPKHYNNVATPLHPIIEGSLELVSTKAEEQNVSIETELQAMPDVVLTDGNATRQVLLNLCLNAIQAQENCSGPRWLRLSTRCLRQGVELIVADNGPGIPTEQRAHLFQAFHSTKSSGFGLGLAICSEIVSSLDGTISVDPFVAGEGAVFRLVFPCPRPIS